MYFEEFIKKYENQQIKIFVDMDGVIADYIVGQASNFDKKRPLLSNIKKLEETSKKSNVELYILSVTRMNKGFEEKNIWLDKFAPFFKKENRYIISRESNDFRFSSDLKTEFLKKYPRDGSIMLFIDDDPENLIQVLNNVKDVIPLKDTILID